MRLITPNHIVDLGSEAKEAVSEWEQAMLLMAQLQNSKLLCDVEAYQAMLHVCQDGRQAHQAVEMLADLRKHVWHVI